MRATTTMMKGATVDMTRKLKESCKYCDKALEDNKFHYIYRILVATDKQVYYIGIEIFLNELGNYAMNKGYHLSASQITLLRPDVVKEFLGEKMSGEKILFFFLQESEICLECFKNEYANLIPLK